MEKWKNGKIFAVLYLVINENFGGADTDGVVSVCGVRGGILDHWVARFTLVNCASKV